MRPSRSATSDRVGATSGVEPTCVRHDLDAPVEAGAQHLFHLRQTCGRNRPRRDWSDAKISMVSSANQSPIRTSIGPPSTISSAPLGRSPKKPEQLPMRTGSLMLLALLRASQGVHRRRPAGPLRRHRLPIASPLAWMRCSIFIASTTTKRYRPVPWSLSRRGLRAQCQAADTSDRWRARREARTEGRRVNAARCATGVYGARRSASTRGVNERHPGGTRRSQ